jgi:hypothetical protein
MSEENFNQNDEGQTPPGSQSWEDVGRQFQTLGESIAAAFRSAWGKEETRQSFQKMQTGLEGMVTEIHQAIQETFDADDVGQLKTDVRKTVDDIAGQGKQTFQEVRPHLVGALQQVNQELQKLIDRMEDQDKGKPSE